MISQIQQAAQGNPQALFNRMMAGNPQFQSFVRDNKGKTPQQIATEHGLDWEQVSRLL